MKKLFIIFGAILVIVVVAFIVANFALGNASEATYYKLGSDQVPSVKEVVGMREVTKVETSTSNGTTTKTVVYKPMEKASEDMYAYVAYLLENEGFEAITDCDFLVDGDEVRLAKDSADSGKIIVLDLSYDANGCTLIFTKTDGTINK